MEKRGIWTTDTSTFSQRGLHGVQYLADGQRTDPQQFLDQVIGNLGKED